MTDVIEVFLSDMKAALHRFEPKPGDVFVLTFPGEISLEQARRIQDEWNKNIPIPTKVAVLTDGVKVELIPADLVD